MVRNPSSGRVTPAGHGYHARMRRAHGIASRSPEADLSQLQVGYQHFVVGKALDRDHARRVYEYLAYHGVDENDVRLAGSATAQLDLAALDPIDAVGRARDR